MPKKIQIDSALLSALAKALLEASSTAPTPAEAAEPRWVRAPIQKEGPCPYTGLKHSAFYAAFADNRRIRQARMGAGKERGTRLFWLPDIFAEIERTAREQQAAKQPQSTPENF